MLKFDVEFYINKIKIYMYISLIYIWVHYIQIYIPILSFNKKKKNKYGKITYYCLLYKMVQHYTRITPIYVNPFLWHTTALFIYIVYVYMPLSDLFFSGTSIKFILTFIKNSIFRRITLFNCYSYISFICVYTEVIFNSAFILWQT